MKVSLAFCTLFLLSWANLALAETRFITDEMRVPLRSSPCGNCSIIHRGLKSGTPLTLVEENGENWSHVTTRNGLDGWLPSQYLMDTPTARSRLADMERRVASLKDENTSLAAQVQALQETRGTLENQLNTATEQRETAADELASIKQISANALSLHSQNEELLKRNRMLQSEIDLLTAANEQLEADSTQRWFFYGALAVFLGALLTILIPRLKPRKKFSEWA